MTHKFFYKPTQVLFINPDIKFWEYGIGYNDEIISLISGKAFNLFHLYQFVNKSNIKEPFYIFQEWEDITDEGSLCTYPPGFIENKEPGIYPNGQIKVYY